MCTKDFSDSACQVQLLIIRPNSPQNWPLLLSFVLMLVFSIPHKTPDFSFRLYPKELYLTMPMSKAAEPDIKQTLTLPAP